MGRLKLKINYNNAYVVPVSVYLSFLNEMTRIVVEGREVLIQKNPHSWKVSYSIFEGRGEFPEEIHQCLKLIQQMKWDNTGKVEVDAVSRHDSLDSADSALEFRKRISSISQRRRGMGRKFLFSNSF
jgi:hypothetical protein